MKKISILLLLTFCFNLPVLAIDVPMPVGTMLNDVGGMQNTNSQLKLLEQQNFRREEYNEFKDMKQVKEERNKKLEYEKKLEEQTKPSVIPSQNVDFVNDNGQIKIKSVE